MTSVQTSQVRRFGLSKSKLTTFEQCPRRLWQQTHAPERGEVDEEQQARMAVGHTVGEIACGLFPDGVMVDADEGLNVAVETTRHLIEEGHPGPIFEATFEHDGVLIRADVLSRDGRDGWHMAEVKSSARVKDYHLGDLATQVWVLGKAGLKVSGAAIRHIDTSFVLEREGDFAGLPGPPWRNGAGRAHGSISKPSIRPSHAGWAPVLTSKCRSSSLCTWSEVMARSRTMSF